MANNTKCPIFKIVAMFLKQSTLFKFCLIQNDMPFDPEQVSRPNTEQKSGMNESYQELALSRSIICKFSYTEILLAIILPFLNIENIEIVPSQFS